MKDDFDPNDPYLALLYEYVQLKYLLILKRALSQSPINVVESLVSKEASFVGLSQISDVICDILIRPKYVVFVTD